MASQFPGVRRRTPSGSVTGVVVVGGGAAGLAAATTAAAAGHAVTLVSEGPLGGDCTWHGCVPTKSMLEAAAAGVDARDAVAHADAVVARLARTENEPALRGLGIDVRRARATLVAGTAVTLSDGDVLVAELGLVLATGSRPRSAEAVLGPVAGLPPGCTVATTVGWLDAVRAHLDRPGPVVVVGGGASGVELAQALARLRAAGPHHGVVLLERAGALLPHLPGAGAVVAASLRADGVQVVTGAEASEVHRALVPGALVLLAAGREPVLDVLGPDAGVVTTAAGVVVDASMRTSAAGVLAAGDVCALRPSTHVAVATGRVAAATLLGRTASFEPAWVPQVVYTDPEVAAVGAVPGGPGTRSVRVPLSRNDRTPAASVPAAGVPGTGRGLSRGWTRGGFAQVWVTHESDGTSPGGGRLAGALVVGPHAGELVGEVALAGRLGLTVEEWVGGQVGLGALAAQHAYPTWSWLWAAVGDRLLGR